MYIPRTHLTMVHWGVIFCKIISIIVRSFVPIYSKLLNYFFISQPVPLHIPCFWNFWFHPQVYKSLWHRIVCFGGCLWLFVVQCDQGWSHANSCFPVVEGAKCFSFGCIEHNISDCFTLRVHGSISLGVGFYLT